LQAAAGGEVLDGDDRPAGGGTEAGGGLCEGTPAEGVVEDSGPEAPAAAFFAGGRDAG
jgi:hypothetical protein